MPNYEFITPDGEHKTAFFTFADCPKVGAQVEIDGVTCKRIFSLPSKPIMNSLSNNDPYSSKDFVKSLDNKNYTVGNMWDASKEASEKREKKEGVDPVKQKFYDNYSKQNNGAEHMASKKAKAKKELQKFNERQDMKDLGVTVKING